MHFIHHHLKHHPQMGPANDMSVCVDCFHGYRACRPRGPWRCRRPCYDAICL